MIRNKPKRISGSSSAPFAVIASALTVGSLTFTSLHAQASTEVAAPAAAANVTDAALTKGDTTRSVAKAEMAVVNQSETVPAGLIHMPPASKYYSPYAFVVDKDSRMLTVWKQTGTGLAKVAAFPADLGKNTGEKKSEGDARTPEGIYFLMQKLEGSQIDFKTYGGRAFTTDYPNFFDRLQAKTGHGIWLHAVPDAVPLTRGSRGCVVVRNNVILDLMQYIRLGRTPILIQNKADLIPAPNRNQQTAQLMQWLESWRSSWEAKDIDGYIAAYGDDFHSMKMNRDQWKTFKKGLNEKYQKISVHLSRPAIFADRDHAVVRFLQEYTSDQHSDFGEKVLYLAKNEKGYRIIGETWSEETSQIAREEIEATTSGAPESKTTTTGDDKSRQSARAD